MTDSRTGSHIRRSRNDRVIAGVAGGIAEQLRVDPVLIRLSFVALAFAGVGIVLYLICWVAIPDADAGSTPAGTPSERDGAMGARLVVGSLLIAVGGLMMLNWAFPIGRYMWPATLIVLGIGIFAFGSRR
jgi:phage shock protein PspC (stress-responsive transcriptional regulator)